MAKARSDMCFTNKCNWIKFIILKGKDSKWIRKKKNYSCVFSKDNPETLWLRNIKSEIIRYSRKVNSDNKNQSAFVYVKQGWTQGKNLELKKEAPTYNKNTTIMNTFIWALYKVKSEKKVATVQ